MPPIKTRHQRTGTESRASHDNPGDKPPEKQTMADLRRELTCLGQQVPTWAKKRGLVHLVKKARAQAQARDTTTRPRSTPSQDASSRSRPQHFAPAGDDITEPDLNQAPAPAGISHHHRPGPITHGEIQPIHVPLPVQQDTQQDTAQSTPPTVEPSTQAKENTVIAALQKRIQELEQVQMIAWQPATTINSNMAPQPLESTAGLPYNLHSAMGTLGHHRSRTTQTRQPDHSLCAGISSGETNNTHRQASLQGQGRSCQCCHGHNMNKATDVSVVLPMSHVSGCCEIKEVTTLDGEAVANNRKAKLIFFYEWDIKAKWKGSIVGSDKTHEGKLEIPNLSEENESQDLIINVTANTSKDEAYEVKEFMRKVGTSKIQDQLGLYMEQLKKEYSQGMILTANNTSNDKLKTTTSPKIDIIKNSPTKNTSTEQSSKAPVDGKPSKPRGTKIPCSKISDKQTFKCRASEIYRALTTKDMVQAFTRANAIVEAEKGGRFELFGGNVSGEFTNLKPDEKIEMRWRFRSWPDAHYSNVTLTFDQKEDCTEMTLLQTGVPKSDLENTEKGWNNYYWRSINQTFGFGASLF